MKTLAMLSVGVLVGICVTGCRGRTHETSPQARETSTTAPAAIEFSSQEHGISLSYPADWVEIQRPDLAWVIVPREDAATESPRKAVSLDVPELPPHLPGFIPLGLVVNGYVNDLKKQHPGVEITKPVETKIAGAAARRVRAKWGLSVEQAVLTVHGDRVYIFRGNSSVEDEADVQAALDAVLASVKWK